MPPPPRSGALPLAGVRVLEFGGMGAAPFAGMLLSDLGAGVDLVDRWDDPYAQGRDPTLQFLNRGKRSLLADLKDPAVQEVVLAAVGQYDAVIEGYRPGVMERLGLGPEVCEARNPALVYARITGWGQSGPYSHLPGHDLNFVAVSGIVDALRTGGHPPQPPLNVVGDMAGGGAMGALAVVSAILAASRTGAGSVLDCAMSEGAALLTTQVHAHRAMGLWRREPGEGLLDGGSPTYRTYATSDDRYVAVGAVEPKLYRALVESVTAGRPRAILLDLDHHDRVNWPTIAGVLAETFRREPMSHWAALAIRDRLALTPVLRFDEAGDDHHAQARGAFYRHGDDVVPAPMPVFDKTRPRRPIPPPRRGEHSLQILDAWGVDVGLQQDLVARGRLIQASRL